MTTPATATASTEEQRAIVVDQARLWLGCPYHLGAMIPCVGVDCATLIVAVYRTCGLMTTEQLGQFSQDWWAHSSEDTYKFRMLRHAQQVLEAICTRSVQTQPGNVVLTSAAGSRLFNHGGIVTRWPKLIHAVSPRVAEVDATQHPMWAHHKIVIFDPWVER